MKKNAVIFALIIILKATSFVQGHTITDKTLFVELFGTSIFNNTQRETELLQYAQSNGYTNLILKGIANIKTGTGLTDYLVRTDILTTTTQNSTLETHLAQFLNSAHSTYGIVVIGAADEPYKKDISNNYAKSG